MGRATTTPIAQALALELKEPFCNCPTAIQWPDQIFLGHLHIGEKGLAEGRISGDQFDRPDFDPRCVHVNQKETDAFVLARIVGAHQTETPIRILRAGGPYFLPVDQIMIAHVDGLRAQRRKIGAGTRFGIALAPAQLPLHNRGDMALFLICIAIFQQRGAKHHNPHTANRIPCTRPLHLLLQDARVFARQAATAILRGPGRRSPPLIAYRHDPALGIRRRRSPRGRHHQDVHTFQRRRKILRQPLPRHTAKAICACILCHRFHPAGIPSLFRVPTLLMVE